MKSIGEWWRQLATFLSETRAEVKKVTFPPRSEVIATTVVVLVASFVFAFYLWFADLVITRLYEGVFNVLGS